MGWSEETRQVTWADPFGGSTMAKHSCKSEHVRALAITNALEEWEAGTKDRWPVPWKGKTDLTPIAIPVPMLERAPCPV